MAYDEKKDSIHSFEDFDAIRLKLASADDIARWSYGEVTRPETINYRTQRPEKDGLFSERIFGPTKDWECYCGKYKKIRYKGIICDKCGVEVTRSIVRRERMGNIDLAAPVSHIWFLRGVPSKIGMLLDMSVQNLEKVLYFASFVVISVDEQIKADTTQQLRDEGKSKRKSIDQDINRRGNELRSKLETAQNAAEKKDIEKQLTALEKEKVESMGKIDDALRSAEEDLKQLKPLRIMSDISYRDLSMKYGHLFEANIGAEAITTLLSKIDLKALHKQLLKEIEETQGLKYEKLVRRAKLVKSFMHNGIKPESMVLSRIPVIPPDLRPMVALDGGRFATSDLNDLYRRVINRNNRLKQLVELKAPEVICRNEKRMLQEAVDALIDNSARHGKTVMASTGQKRQLKSLADMLKGKRGRFRQNLLGKRIDYSGRSVIVVGPSLKIHQCGLPKTMALDLFKPFVMGQLISRGYVYNVRSASRFIESGRDEVWDILEDIVRDSYVLLNRAPTLHRLGIQAFKPILIEGKAIQIHPLVCPAFNADFDGDQMAVHVPLSAEAREEAETLMLASRNLLKPATGDPIAMPNQDIVLGAFHMTYMDEDEEARSEGIKTFASETEGITAYLLKMITLQEKIFVRPTATLSEKLTPQDREKKRIETTIGRILFNASLPPEIPFYNTSLEKKKLSEIVLLSLERCGMVRTAQLLDHIKEICTKYLTESGMSFGMADIPTLPEKPALIRDAEKRIDDVQNQYDMGLLTSQERKSRVITIWTEVRDKIAKMSEAALDRKGSTYSIIRSGARGSWTQLNQVVGMKGLVANPAGEIIELAIKSSFKEGLDVLEFFISTHGARKGLADTALRTSSAGYLTRRLVDVAQDIVVTEEDCGDRTGFTMTKKDIGHDGDFGERVIGRTIAQDVLSAKKKVVLKSGELVTKLNQHVFRDEEVESVAIRSLLTCTTLDGICRQCYGIDLAYNEMVKEGTAVGIIAAQSLGEPGTQLTMRTFHTGGVAQADITQGLPRVEELFEARPPKNKALIAEVGGKASIHERARSTVDAQGKELLRTAEGKKIISIEFDDIEEDVYRFSPKKKTESILDDVQNRPKKKKGTLELKTEDGAHVKSGDILFVSAEGIEVKSRRDGKAKIEKLSVKVQVPVRSEKEYIVPAGAFIIIKDGDTIEPGDALTEGDLDLQIIFKFKGKEATQKYIINEIQHIYSSQGQKINDKHIEAIVRQLFSRIYVTDSAETDLIAGEVVERGEFIESNLIAKKADKQEAKGRELLMGITKASLSTRSWLSAASFQETARVLINAAVTGKADYLRGLKENVIIGRLIPVGTGYEERKRRRDIKTNIV
ncbi:MAG: DNA-directed RNA polymerase subunit beta' [Patescibacteria group bacterium]